MIKDTVKDTRNPERTFLVNILLYTTTLSRLYLNHLQFSNVLIDKRVILKDKMCDEKFANFLTFYTSTKLGKLHAVRLKSMNKIPFI